MEAFDIVKDICSCFGMSGVASAIHTLAFQHAEEAFRSRVVGAAAHGTHRTGQIVAPQEPLIFIAGELTAAIAVQDHRLSRFALPQRHQHGLQNELAILTTTHRPADNDTGVQIDDHAQIQPLAAADSDVSDVRHPLRIRIFGSEVPSELVLDIRRPRARRLAAVLFLARDTLDLIGAHQPSHAVQAAGFAFLTQIVPQPRCAQHLIALSMQDLDTLQQTLIVDGSRTQRPIPPAVIAAW